MKKGILVIILGILLTFTMVNGQVKTVTFACEDKTDFPFVLGDGATVQADKPGVSIEMLQSVAKKVGVTLKFVRYPWQRCLETMKEGSVDGVFTASFKEERKQYGEYPMLNGQVDPTRRMTTITYAFYVAKGTKFPWDGKTLGTLTGNVGAPAGYSIVDDLKKMGATVEESPSTLNDFKKLASGRLVAVAALEETGDYYLRQNPDLAAKIERFAIPIVSKPYYIMFSHQFYAANKDLTEKFWAEIAKFRDSPDFKALFAKYL